MDTYSQLSQLSHQLSHIVHKLGLLLKVYASDIDIHLEAIRELEAIHIQLHNAIKIYSDALAEIPKGTLYIATLQDAFQNLSNSCKHITSSTANTSNVTANIVHIANELNQVNQFIEETKKGFITPPTSISIARTKGNIIIFPNEEDRRRLNASYTKAGNEGQPPRRLHTAITRKSKTTRTRRPKTTRTKRADASYTKADSDEQQPSRHNIKRHIVYLCHARPGDDQWRDKIREHLKPYEKACGLKVWDTKDIEPGNIETEERQAACARAKVAVILISHHLCADDKFNEELPKLSDAVTNDGLIIIPVIVHPFAYADTHPSLTPYTPANDFSHALETLNATEQKLTLKKICESIVTAMRS